MNPPTGAGRRLRRWSSFVFLGLALSSTGCAYYNTFYLAKRYYRDAVAEEERNTTDRVAPAATASYDKAIKQCARILQKYRGSKWVDDALLLTGKSFYGQGNYGEARRWLTQLVNDYPKSELRTEAQVWIGRTWLAEEDFEKSGTILHDILADNPQFDGRSEAVFFAAETELRQEHWEEAIAGYRELVDRYPKSERLGEALLRVGDAQAGLRQYEEAERSYRQSASRARDPRARMHALLRVGQMLEKQERFDEARHLYDGLSAEIVTRDKLNTILSGFDAVVPNQPGGVNQLNSGQTEQQQIEQGSYVDANGVKVFPNPNVPRDGFPVGTNPNGTAGDVPATPVAPPDPRRTGEGNVAARTAFSEALAGNPLAADLPQVLLRQGNALMETGEYDKAIKTFESVLASTPHTSEAGEAQYRIGYILEVYLEDYASARIAYDLVKQHGAGLFVEQATRRSGGLERLVALAAQDSTRAVGADATLEAEAEKQFLAAELAWFQQEKPEKAIELYAEVEKNYPNTNFAARSALARAWLLANVMADTTAGREAFESVTVQYADTEQARVAHQILTGEVIRSADAPDSLAIAAFEDSLLRAEALADSQAALAAQEQAAEAASDSLRAADAAATAATAAGLAPATDTGLAPATEPMVHPADASGDSLAEALEREAARQRSEEEARALAEASPGGDGTAVAQAVTAEELARLGIQQTPETNATASPGTTNGTSPPVADTPGTASPAGAGAAPGAVTAAESTATESTAAASTPVSDRPSSRLAPETATGLPRPFSVRRPATGTPGRPVRPRPQAPKPNPVPATSDSTHGSGRGRLEQAWP